MTGTTPGPILWRRQIQCRGLADDWKVIRAVAQIVQLIKLPNTGPLFAGPPIPELPNKLPQG
ncbi:hypothetical protein N7451_012377 [Penicillium sp. IBT 35674x]|nr:hypothetical protein N7451_012377 [Penicillium sp. IBT 35674x]